MNRMNKHSFLFLVALAVIGVFSLWLVGCNNRSSV